MKKDNKAPVIERIESTSIPIGKIVKVHGVNGQLVVRLDRAVADILDFPEWAFLHTGGGPVPFYVLEESVFQKDSYHIVIGLRGISNPEQAAVFIGAACLLEGEWTDWFSSDSQESESLTGYEILDETSGLSGSVTGFEDIPGNPLLEIEISGKKTLVPLNAGFLTSKDEKRRIIHVRLPEGLINL